MDTEKYGISDSPQLEVGEPRSHWGGPWTEQKLDVFINYVKAYLTIMNKHRDQNGWQLIYFDGFSGSGRRESGEGSSPAYGDKQSLFSSEDLSEEEMTVYQGAAERVMRLDTRGFDYYYFIEKSQKASDSLRKMLTPMERRECKYSYRASDCNEQLLRLASAVKASGGKLKSLVLLDPFGMQVDWSSIESLKGAGVDLWILIPTGVIINRLLDQKGELQFSNKLTSFFGMSIDEIKNHFYYTERTPSLFDEEIATIKKVSDPIRKTAELYIKRMQGIFGYVTERPLVMYNTRNFPLYHFAFGSNNKAAYNIASQIIGKRQ